MTPENGLQLVILALIDSTSLGTLVIPLWLLLRRGTQGLGRKVSLYLAVLGGFYFLLGVLLLSGGHVVVERYGDVIRGAVQSPGFRWAALAVGVALIVFGFSGPWSKADREKAAAKKAGAALAKANRVKAASGAGSGAGSAAASGVVPSAELDGALPGGGAAKHAVGADDDDERLAAVQGGWGRRIDTALRSPAALVGLALIAGLLEVPTMLPYLAASGILVASSLPLATQVLTLAGYCVVMMLPALLLFGARMALGSRADGWFGRIGAKLGQYVSESSKWVAAIVGILIIRWASSGPDAVGFSQLMELISQR